ncbi:MAG: diacylglycerol kinase [Candidatus Adiutrix sp.]
MWLETFKNIPKRIITASAYSLAGLKSAFMKEEAIRLETVALVILVVLMVFVPWPLWKKLVMVTVFLLIILCELFNSAIEDICDLVTLDYNIKIKNAKDKGSAGVLIAILINVLTLLGLICL